MSYHRWKPYVPVAKRRAKAEKEMKKLAKGGKSVEPVVIDGRKIARTFWGEAWCEHLEKFSDYENRLPRGRTYVRNGSVCHLGIGEGRIEAMVSGSELYEIEIKIDPLPQSKWKKLRDQCTGKIGSALELLQGKLSKEVMQIVTDREQGLFPKPKEIHMQCSCPDWAGLCKHLAAVLYGIGARLDDRPELLFQLRGVDPQELIGAELALGGVGQGQSQRRRLDDDDLSGLFGVEIEDEPAPRRPKAVPTKSPAAAKPAPAATPAPKAKRTRKTAPEQTPTETRPGQKAPAPVTPKPLANPAKLKDAEFIPTGAKVAELRARLGMNKTQFARLLGVSAVSIGNWEGREGLLNLQESSLAALRRVATMAVGSGA
jgi:uncharacterized Zn finger protein/DNA-binding XRE family transcriptional regulator